MIDILFMAPLVSLIMTIYNRENREAYLVQAIESALAQIEANFELLTLNDGSTDGSVGIAERYAALNRRIRLINAKHQKIESDLIFV